MEAAADQVEVGAPQSQHQQRRGGDVGDRVGERHLGRDRLARPPVETSSPGITTIPSRPSGGSKRAANGGARRRADDEPAVDRRRDVVGVPLDLGRPRQQLLARQRQLEEVVGGDQSRDDRRRARAEPARQRDLGAQAEGDPVGGVERLERPHDQVVAPGRAPRGRRGRTRTPRSPRPPAPGAAPPPPPSRRTPARGWPRRRGRGRVGGGRSSAREPRPHCVGNRRTQRAKSWGRPGCQMSSSSRM